MHSIAWGLTGAGSFLKESVDVIRELSQKGFAVTVYVSRAAEELLNMYGVRDLLERAATGDYPSEVIYESEEGFSYPRAARVYRHPYAAAVIAPASMNTVAKIVSGIADSLVTNLAMHSIKAGLPLLVLPVDIVKAKSYIPIAVNRSKCGPCAICLAALRCPTGALLPHQQHKVRVLPAKCTRCRVCEAACPYGAIKFDVEIEVEPHPYYVEIARRLERIPRVKIIRSPLEVMAELENSLANGD